jgi:alpha-tubulin suppressor-like RCC1 family protein
MRTCVYAIFRVGLAAFWVAGCPSKANDGNTADGGQGTSPSCSYLDGTWVGHEVGLDGSNLGPLTMVVRDSQVEFDISLSGAPSETYTMTASCNPAVEPNQMTGTIASSNQAGAAGLAYYAIYDLDPATHTGQCSLTRPGMGDLFPTAFAASASQRLFVFDRDGSAGDVDSGAPRLSAKAISAGSNSTCALLFDGTIRCWGYNDCGQLGNGTTGGKSSVPVEVLGISTAIAVSVGWDHACAVLENGAIRCWGSNMWGQLGNGATQQEIRAANKIPNPVEVPGISDAVVVSAGMYRTCAVLRGGSVRCWGEIGPFGLGDGTKTGNTYSPNIDPISSIPVTVVGVQNAIDVAAGNWFACAVESEGTAWCWGFNSYGQLGIGMTQDGSLTPVQVPGISNARTISARGVFTNGTTGYACVVLKTGAVRCWGYNGYGTCGGSSTTVDVPGIANARAVSVDGLYHTCAVLEDGTIKCWGSNNHGELGLGSHGYGSASAHPPTTVLGITDAVGVAAGGTAISAYTCAVLRDGVVRCWGSPGALGNDTSPEGSDVPVTVNGF